VLVDSFSHTALHNLDPEGSGKFSRAKTPLIPQAEMGFPQGVGPCCDDDLEREKVLPWN
jgi:hypothetical protein